MKNKVHIQKPNHRLLNNLGGTVVDMHFHTKYSDGSATIDSLIRRAKKLGIGVAVTDHNEVAGAVEAFNNNEGVLVIPGIEVSCIEGPHILLYFYDIRELVLFFENFLKEKKNGNPYMAVEATVEEVLKESSKYKCFKVAAHPFGYMAANCGLLKAVRKKYIADDVLKKIDGVEVLCGAMNRYLNKRAQVYAESYGTLYTGGSDGHCLFQLGQVVTVGKGKTVAEFLDSLKDKENLVVGREARSIPKVISVGKCVGAHMHYAYPSVKIQSRMFYSRTVHFRKAITGKIFNNGVAKKIGKAAFRRL